MTSFFHSLSARFAYFPLHFTRPLIEVGHSFCGSSSALHPSFENWTPSAEVTVGDSEGLAREEGMSGQELYALS